MKRILSIGFTYILFLTTAVYGFRAIDVIHHPDQKTALEKRWAWAEKQGRQDHPETGFWIGYSIEKMMGVHSYTGCFRHGHRDDDITLSELIYGVKLEEPERFLSDDEVIRKTARDILNEIEGKKELDKEVLKELVLLFQYSRDGSLRDIRFSNISLHADLDDMPLLWLGKSDFGQSIAHLKGLYRKTTSDDHKEDLVSAVGLHAGSDEAVDFLEDVLTGKASSDIRENAAFWLGQTGIRRALTILVGAVKNDRSTDVREKAVFAISQVDTEESFRILTDLALTLDNQDVREQAIFWLGQTDRPEALKTLLGIARSTSSNIAEKAVFAISQLACAGSFEALTDLAYNGKTTDVREQAVFWLGQTDNPDVLKILLDLCKNRSDDIAEKAVFSISQLDHEASTNALIDLARHADQYEVRKQAIFWLGQKASEKAVTALDDMVYSESETELQKQAVFAISQLDNGESVPRLIKIVKTHPNQKIRKQAIFWLGQTEDSRAVDMLEDILKS